MREQNYIDDKNEQACLEKIADLEELVGQLSERLTLWTERALRAENSKISLIPCASCDGEVIEFSIPNDIWNRVIRIDGYESDDEYLCINCFFNALRQSLNLPVS